MYNSSQFRFIQKNTSRKKHRRCARNTRRSDCKTWTKKNGSILTFYSILQQDNVLRSKAQFLSAERVWQNPLPWSRPSWDTRSRIVVSPVFWRIFEKKKTLVVQIYLGTYQAAQFYLETSLVGLKTGKTDSTELSQITARVYFKLFSKDTTELHRCSTKPEHASQIKNG